MSDIRDHGGISGCGKSDVDFGVTPARRAFEDGHGRAQSPVERKRILLRRIGLLGRIVILKIPLTIKSVILSHLTASNMDPNRDGVLGARFKPRFHPGSTQFTQQTIWP